MNLIAEGIEVCEGALVLIEEYFEITGSDPVNNDNYCRIADWIEKANKYIENKGNDNGRVGIVRT